MSKLDFQTECLNAHNIARAKHNTPPLRLNPQISSYAQEWANNIAARNLMQHRTPNKYGENIFWGGAGGNYSGKDAVDNFYSEIQYYNYNASSHNYMQTGHFTQVVWKDSTELGVGVAHSHDGSLYVVCNYNPPGNYGDRYAQNVLPVCR